MEVQGQTHSNFDEGYASLLLYEIIRIEFTEESAWTNFDPNFNSH